MPYESVDRLQNVLADKVFVYAKDSKKAAGRALGTLVEIITFYLLKSWGFEHSIAIETSLAEYGNPEIVHNVEYSVHPILAVFDFEMHNPHYPVTSARIWSELRRKYPNIPAFDVAGATLLSSDKVLRNSCIISKGTEGRIVAFLDSVTDGDLRLSVTVQHLKPYAMVECKRVGVEEGMRKGPQTIEKAKQGAYVARTVSNLQKVRLPSGALHGIIFKPDQSLYSKPYRELITEVIASVDAELLRDFVLTVGIVSNHGNWFTSDDHNKELKVLAQSYDWLLFLTDSALSEFITELLLSPQPLLEPARNAFLSSYSTEKVRNRFTKVQMDYQADQVLQTYFRDNSERIEQWFNVIAPSKSSIESLKLQLSQLRDKDWDRIHQ
jgi:hypothetical protein